MRKKVLLPLLILMSESLSGQAVQLVSQDLNKFQNLRDFCISSDESEAYFTIQSPNQDLSQLVCVKNKNWSNPELLPFCDGYAYMEPFLSKDGRRLYFASDRPKTESESLKSDFDLWYVERSNKNSPWSKPVNMGNQVNTEGNEFYPTLADNGNLYFTLESASGLGKDDIYCCIWDGTVYSRPVLLNKNINSEGFEFNAFIAKDETFLLYTKYNAKDGMGSGDLYVSKKNEKGEWGVAENLGSTLNTRYMEYCPFYDPQTNTLYFTSRRSTLIPEKFEDLNAFQDCITGSENGLSKLYKCKMSF